MTRSFETEEEQRKERKARLLLAVCSSGLSASVDRAGARLTGFSAKLAGDDCLLTIRAEFPGGPMIAWCGGETLANALLKAAREAQSDNLRWKVDEYA